MAGIKLGPPLLLPVLATISPQSPGHRATAAGTPQDSSACPWRAGGGPFYKLNCSYRLPCLWLNTKCSTECRIIRTEQNSTGSERLRATPALWPLDINPREGQSQPLASERVSALEKIMRSHSSHNKNSEVSDLSDLELKRLSLKRKTRHLPAKINCDESLGPPPSSPALPVLASPVCLAPAQACYF